MNKFLIAFCFGLFLCCGVSRAQSKLSYESEKQVPLAGNGGYDYLFLDTASGRLYISHGDVVLVYDVRGEKVVGSITGMKGVHGIALAPEFGKGFISDGDGNSVVAFDLTSLEKLKTIPITGKDPDAIMYDPFSKKVFTFDGDSKDASVVDPATLTQVGTVPLGGQPEFAVSDGKGLIYNNLEDKSVLNVIDARSLKVLKTFPLDPCGGPTGLAIDKVHHRLFTVCRKNKGMSVIDITTGKVIATVPIGSGVDAVVYDGTTGYVYCSNGDGTASLIHQDSPDQYTVEQTIQTQWKAKTMALDPGTKKIYFVSFDMDSGNKNRIPGTFKLLIYKPKS